MDTQTIAPAADVKAAEAGLNAAYDASAAHKRVCGKCAGTSSYPEGVCSLGAGIGAWIRVAWHTLLAAEYVRDGKCTSHELVPADDGYRICVQCGGGI